MNNYLIQYDKSFFKTKVDFIEPKFTKSHLAYRVLKFTDGKKDHFLESQGSLGHFRTLKRRGIYTNYKHCK